MSATLDPKPDMPAVPAPASGVAFAALGLTAGFVSAFLGIGGGLVIVPVLMAALHYPIRRAVGTSLLTIIPVAAVGVLAESVVQGANIRWPMGGVLTLGSLLGSWLGGKLAARAGERRLRALYSLFLLVAAWRMTAASGSAAGSGIFSLGERPLLGYGLAAAAGVLAGVSSVLFGVGGGIVHVPALSLLLREFPFHAARATSLVTIVPTSAYGAVQHRRLGTVDFAAARRLIPPGLIGAVLGVITVNRLPARPCRLAFAVFLVVAAVRIATLRRERPASHA